MLPQYQKIIDISLELDATKFRMRTYEGFTKDMQFDVEVIKEYPGGPHGLADTHKETLNADLLAFAREAAMKRSPAGVR